MKILTLLLSILFSSLAYSQLQDKVVCEKYTTNTMNQIQEAKSFDCKVSGARWSKDKNSHSKWCLSLSKRFKTARRNRYLKKESSLRNRAIKKCKTAKRKAKSQNNSKKTSQKKKAAARVALGAAAGAAYGTAVMPGVGTAVGYAVGATAAAVTAAAKKRKDNTRCFCDLFIAPEGDTNYDIDRNKNILSAEYKEIKMGGGNCNASNSCQRKCASLWSKGTPKAIKMLDKAVSLTKKEHKLVITYRYGQCQKKRTFASFPGIFKRYSESFDEAYCKPLAQQIERETKLLAEQVQPKVLNFSNAEKIIYTLQGLRKKLMKKCVK